MGGADLCGSPQVAGDDTGGRALRPPQFGASGSRDTTELRAVPARAASKKHKGWALGELGVRAFFSTGRGIQATTHKRGERERERKEL
jgi:hypothetical protein